MHQSSLSPIFCCFILLMSLPVAAESMDDYWSARHRGLSGARTAMFADPASVAVNPSGLSSLESFSVSSSITPGIVGLRELTTHCVLIAIPVRFGGIGIGARTFGFDLYNERSLLVGSGIVAGDGLSVGLSSEFRRYSIAGYGTQTVTLLTIGATRTVYDIFRVTGTIHNVLNATLGKSKEPIPRILSLGILAEAGSSFLGLCEIEMNTRDPAFLKAAVEFRPMSLLAISAGFSTEPMVWSLGFTVSSRIFSFGYGGTNHDVLGWTHQLEIGFRWAE